MKKRDVIQLKNAKIPGLRRWCDACNTVVTTCKKNGKNLTHCENIDRLSYRAVLKIPGESGRIVRALGKDFNKAVEKLAQLRQQVENGGLVKEDKRAQQSKVVKPSVQQQKESQPELLFDIFARYLATLKGAGVPKHLIRIRSKDHVRDVKNIFKTFCKSLTKAGYNMHSYRLADIDDAAVGVFHEALEAHGYSARSYNRFLSVFTTFSGWAEMERLGDVKRFFERVPRKTVSYNPEIITRTEFDTLIESIRPETGLQYNVGKRKESRNHYRDFLATALKYSLLTGKRIEEILNSKFNDILCDENSKPICIVFKDYKVSHILHLPEGQERKLFTPVSNELAEFLDELGFQEKRNTNEYIIAPEITKNRIAQLRIVIPRGFSHYWQVAFPESSRQLTYKCLRKTMMTSLAIRMGQNIREVSGHASEQVLRHYVNEQQVALAKSLNDFSVFGEQERRKIQRGKPKEKIVDR